MKVSQFNLSTNSFYSIYPLSKGFFSLYIVFIQSKLFSNYYFWIVILTNLLAFNAHSADFDDASYLQRLQLQRESLKSKLQPKTEDIHLIKPVKNLKADEIVENPCYQIREVELIGVDQFAGLSEKFSIKDKLIDRCVGILGIQQFMNQVQNTLISKGMITSRVLAPAQDLETGLLTLNIVAGKVNNISLDTVDKSTESVNLKTVMPLRKGDLLNVRAIEQALENLQRLTSVQASFDISPAQNPGESNISVKWQQTKPWRVLLSADDSGADATGKYQGNIAYFYGNLFGLSDLVYLSAGNDLHENQALATHNYSAHYSVPFGYWQLDINASVSDYLQSIHGLNRPILYSGSSVSKDIALSRVVHRDSSSKTTLSFKAVTRSSDNYIDDVEVEIQRRSTSYGKLSLQHNRNFKKFSLTSELSYRQGTRWFGAEAAPEESVGTATALTKLINFNLNVNRPFAIGSRPIRWSAKFVSQWTTTKLTAQDKFNIGNRYSVRGFDGSQSLSADEGWYLQNEWAMKIAGNHSEAFIGIDIGKVYGNGSELLQGTKLAGAIVGVKGNKDKLSYQFFVATPLYKPNGFKAKAITAGFNMNYQF